LRENLAEGVNSPEGAGTGVWGILLEKGQQGEIPGPRPEFGK